MELPKRGGPRKKYIFSHIALSYNMRLALHVTVLQYSMRLTLYVNPACRCFSHSCEGRPPPVLGHVYPKINSYHKEERPDREKRKSAWGRYGYHEGQERGGGGCHLSEASRPTQDRQRVRVHLQQPEEAEVIESLVRRRLAKETALGLKPEEHSHGPR